MPLGRDSGCCKRANLPRSILFEHPRAGIERRPGRAHIVNEHDDTSQSQTTVFAWCKCALHIAVAFPGGKIGLRRRLTNAAECGDDRKTDMTCEVFCLIKSALTAS